MPELYGHPFKNQLRRQIRELETELAKKDAQLFSAANKCERTEVRCELLEARVRKITKMAEDLLAEANSDLSELLAERNARRKAERRAEAQRWIAEQGTVN